MAGLFFQLRTENILALRPADESDLLELLSWRNDEVTRAMSLNGEMISKNDHSNWYLRALRDPSIKILIAELRSGEKCGMCRFELNVIPGKSRISIIIDPSFRGRGLGKVLLKSCIDYYRQDFKGPIVAQVKKNNKASLSLFKGIGFEITHTTVEFVELESKLRISIV